MNIKIRISTVLAIIALVLNVMELFLVDDYMMRHGGWGGIPMYGIPWFFSLLCLVSAIVIGVLEGIKKNRQKLQKQKEG